MVFLGLLGFCCFDAEICGLGLGVRHGYFGRVDCLPIMIVGLRFV